MKKIIARLMAAALVFTATSLFLGCSNETKPTEKKPEAPKKDEPKKDK